MGFRGVDRSQTANRTCPDLEGDACYGMLGAGAVGLIHLALGSKVFGGGGARVRCLVLNVSWHVHLPCKALTVAAAGVLQLSWHGHAFACESLVVLITAPNARNTSIAVSAKTLCSEKSDLKP